MSVRAQSAPVESRPPGRPFLMDLPSHSPKRLGRYKLLRMIATGGMGEVYLARQEGPAGFAKGAVVKRILPHLANDPAFVEMFLNEARLAAVLNHPNVVQIFELGQAEGTYFIAMEYVHGRSLRAIRKRAEEIEFPVPLILYARLMSLALQGLHHAHMLTDSTGASLNIVHRDVSPDNVLIGFNGAVKLVDFGIAKASVGVSVTRTGSVKGKFAYMSPEQLTGGAADGRADVYSAGVVLYELITGGRPFVAPTEPALISAVLNDTPLPPKARNPAVHVMLDGLVMKALSKKPEDRFQSADEMSAALEDYIHEAGGTTGASQGQILILLRHLFGADEATTNPGISPVPSLGGVLIPSSPSNPSLRARKSKVAAKRADTRPPPSDDGTVAISTSFDDLPVERAHQRPLGLLILCTVLLVLLGGLGAYTFLREAPPAMVAPAVQEPANNPPLDVVVVKPTPEIVPPIASEPRVIAKHETSSEAQRTDASTTNRPVRHAPLHHLALPQRGIKHSSEPTLPGRVSVRVNPWAEVFLGGKSLGVTPLESPIELPAGRQTLTLKNTELGVERKVTITVPADGDVTVKINMLDVP